MKTKKNNALMRMTLRNKLEQRLISILTIQLENHFQSKLTL